MKTVRVSLHHSHQIVDLLPLDEVPPEVVDRMAKAMNRRIEESLLALLSTTPPRSRVGCGIRADVP